MVIEFSGSFAGPLATLLAALAAGGVATIFGRIQSGIAKQQAETAAAAALVAQNKLRLELFDRRLAVVTAVRAMFGKVDARGEINFEDERAFLQGIDGARWLFGAQVGNYLSDDLWRLMNHLMTALAVMDGQEGSPDFSRLRESVTKALEALRTQRPVFMKMMDRYMTIEVRNLAVT